MTDVFISYARDDRELMVALQKRLEEIGLELFVDIDGPMDRSSAYTDAIDAGVRAAKAVLGCWTPYALTREWVKIECGMANDANKLVAVVLEPLTAEDVPAHLYYAERKDLTDFQSDGAHEGWARTLTALAIKLRTWAAANSASPEAEDALSKAERLELAAAEEHSQAALVRPRKRRERAPSRPAAIGAVSSSGVVSGAWASIENSADRAHYERFITTFRDDPSAFSPLLEAEKRLEAIGAWEQVDQTNPYVIEAAISSGWFDALQERARQRAEQVRDDGWVYGELKRMVDTAKQLPPELSDYAERSSLIDRLRRKPIDPPVATALHMSRPLRKIQRPGRSVYEGLAADVVVVPKGARVEGDVFGNWVWVFGRVEGRIRGRKVELRAPCRVIGDVMHSSLNIGSNAVFEGGVKHADAIWG